jgi:hypothetical protein
MLVGHYLLLFRDIGPYVQIFMSVFSFINVAMVMLLKQAFDLWLMFCGKNALKQKAVYSSMAYYVHVFFYKPAKEIVYVVKLSSFRSKGKISN